MFLSNDDLEIMCALYRLLMFFMCALMIWKFPRFSGATL